MRNAFSLDTIGENCFRTPCLSECVRFYSIHTNRHLIQTYRILFEHVMLYRLDSCVERFLCQRIQRTFISELGNFPYQMVDEMGLWRQKPGCAVRRQHVHDSVIIRSKSLRKVENSVTYHSRPKVCDITSENNCNTCGEHRSNPFSFESLLQDQYSPP